MYNWGGNKTRNTDHVVSDRIDLTKLLTPILTCSLSISSSTVHGDTIDSRLLSFFSDTFTTAIAALQNHDSNR